ncbi:MAG: hypothetical protein JSS57_09785 [Proteobacteria bacterium]|nr:hypothetical protein [Pseudomonadota bacterium]
MMMAVESTQAASTASSGSVACFGRFIVDLPVGAMVSGLSTSYRFGQVRSERVSLDAKGFAEKMSKRERVIKEQGRDDSYQLLQSLASSEATRVFKMKWELLLGPSFGLEAYRLDQGVLFSMKEEGFSQANIDRVVQEVDRKLLQNIRYRIGNEVPSEPGLCIDRGFIGSDGSENASERIKLFFDFEKWPELSLTVASWTVTKPEPSLLTRLNSAAVPEVFLSLMGQIKTLRRGKHDVGLFKGEESLDMVPADGGYKMHMFRWEAQGVPGDPFKPNLVVELTTGRNSGYQDKRPTISEQEAVELFDAVVNSIRLRPTGPAKRSEATPIPKAPLGEMATTGRQCPQTGRWQAEEGEERLIREGEVMPHTPVSGTASLWQKLRGEAAPTYRSATVWKLVAYETPTDDTPFDGQGHTG